MEHPKSSTSESRTVRVVCISDTHNDVFTPDSIPSGDIFIHAGDLTDFGTYEEMKKAFDWISSLPHEVKVVIAGNHDFTLDPFHPKTTREKYLQTRHLFTSSYALSRGVHYLDSEVKSIALKACSRGGKELPAIAVPIYGNQHQPEFLGKEYAFIYRPYPSPESEIPWRSAPTKADGVNIWVLHGGPKDRLDAIPLPGLEGCTVAARKIAQARPQLCVFGHFHVSHGVERVQFKDGSEGVAHAEIITKKSSDPNIYDFSRNGPGGGLKAGTETIFVNAAWMTGLGAKTAARNRAVVVDLDLPVSLDS